MAEMSVNKGRSVAQIERAGGQSGGLSRTQVSPPPKTDEDGQRGRGEEEEAKEFLVELGEEAKRSLKQRPEEAASPAASDDEAGPEAGRTQGGKVDVVI